MMIHIFILIIGFFMLVKGADIFVDAASSLAKNFHLSPMFIALTIVAFGTSAPEFAVSISAMLSHSGEMVIGNVIGSNILNILLILGISGCVHSLNVKNTTVKKELPITILISTLFLILMSDVWFANSNINSLTRSDGMVILLFFTIFLYYLFSIMRNKKDENSSEPAKYNIPLSFFFTFLGIVCLVLGSKAVVSSASEIASILGVSERIIALTIVALGTSLPELVTSVIATKKGEYDIAIGNVVGSNIFNIGIVIGLPLTIFGSISSISFPAIDLFMMLLSTVLLFLFSFKTHKINRTAGIVFLLLFSLYYGHMIITCF